MNTYEGGRRANGCVGYALNGAEKSVVMRSDLVLYGGVWQVLVYPV